MKKTFKINKLVRDNILTIMEKQNIVVHYRVLEEKEYLQELKTKLLEEAQEVLEETNTEDVLEEMGDVLEVLHGLCAYYNISMDDLNEKRALKTKKRGNFSQRLYNTFVDIQDDNPHIHYFLNKPHIYPEVFENEDKSIEKK